MTDLHQSGHHQSDDDVAPLAIVGSPGVAASEADTAAPAPDAHSRPRTRLRGRARAQHLRERTCRVLSNRSDVLAVIAAGGAIGSLARWELARLMPHRALAFPWATFLTNVSGCLLLGVLMVFVIDVWPPSRYVRPFLGVGVLGGFTTFSSYVLDARGLLVAGRTAAAGVYVFGSLASGLLAVWIGVTVARLAIQAARSTHRRQLPPVPRDHEPNPTPTTTPTTRPTTRRSR